MLAQDECGPRFSVLEQDEKRNQSLVHKQFVVMGQWGLTVQLIICEAEDGSLEGLWRRQTSRGWGSPGSHLSPKEKGGLGLFFQSTRW